MWRAALVLTSALALVSSRAEFAAGEDKAVSLFNGKDLSGWTHHLFQQGKPDASLPASDVWSVEEGVLICSGKPSGYLRTKSDYENYLLTLEWRFPEGSEGGNSGVLVHTSTPEALGIWPKSIEVQLFRGNAGDFWVIGTDLDVENEEARKSGRRHLNLTDDSEKPIGQWNKMEITCKADEIIVKVNDVLVNHATKCTATKGAICLQSEGAPVQFRSIQLRPLE
jgi:hypothetical protein